MTIIKGNPTKDGRIYSFKVRYTDLSGESKQYLSKKYALKKEAQDAERKFMLSLTDKVDKVNITFKDLMLEHQNFKKDKVKVTSYSNYNKMYKLLESLSKIKVNEFNITQFNIWKETIDKKDCSIRYKNEAYKFLRSLLNFSNKYLNTNTSAVLNKMTGFSNPNELKKEMQFYTYDEFKLFIKNESDIKYKAYFETLYYCGLRKGEANALTWKDIDFENKTININKNLSMKVKGEKYVLLPPKTKSSNRILLIPDVLYNSLKELYTYWSKYDNFKNNWFIYGGIFPLADSTVAKRNETNAKAANIKHIRIHDFRHSCASLLITNGSSVSLVAKYLGHSNITTTLNTYTHMFKNEFDDIIKTINNLK